MLHYVINVAFSIMIQYINDIDFLMFTYINLQAYLRRNVPEKEGQFSAIRILCSRHKSVHQIYLVSFRGGTYSHVVGTLWFKCCINNNNQVMNVFLNYILSLHANFLRSICFFS